MKITPNYPPQLRAISIGGAYGYLICTGQKECEARVWPTKFRGPVLIHVPTSTAWDFSFTEEDVDPQRCPKTAIIGYAEVVDCQSEIYEGEQIYLHYMENGLLLPSPILGVKGSFKYWQAKELNAIAAFNHAWGQIQQLRTNS